MKFREEETRAIKRYISLKDCKEIAEKYDFSRETLYNILSGKTEYTTSSRRKKGMIREVISRVRKESEKDSKILNNILKL